ncbi:unnamed protein product (macronuclear) [Paramecium tetraurelia]|uniref:Radial spoke protein 3 n=1 Tax=Paramecium tetraurelia TaxID=5888 RepID=A0EFV7_PARTE|nr:uncharacterized protein GSPATT00026521001 [Paramecium tetraurelia]CAK94198.1 unnamed protein product [Paramecium tetraurelia]|eukprot:XP_001461571.1 hypothetical protein (macronuclear) [Paramecium tetraurelia strain d4-2]
MQAQANVYQFEAEPQVSHPKYRDQDLYEELTDLPDDESRIKPDYYIDRPATPEYKPLPKGIDRQTQIEAYEPDLFDYKLEVEPVLQVLVGKSVEQARMELIEESEREELQIQKAAFEKKRNAELMVTQRMEAAYVRRKEERERRLLQHKLYQDQMKLSQQKFIARALSKGVLKGVNSRILNDLQNLGLLRNDHILELKVNTLPWLVERIKQNCNNIQTSQNGFQSFLEEIQTPILQEHSFYYQKEQQKRQEHLDRLEKRRIEIEEQKKRKAEIKRRRALKEKREVQRSALYNLTLSKAETSNSIFQVNIQEGTAEVGQKGVVLHLDLFLLLAEGIDLITGDQLDQIDESIIQTIWLDILMNKCNQFNITINSAMQPLIQEALNKIDEDLYVFEKNAKQLTIEFLRSQSPFWSSYVSQQFVTNIRKTILNKLLDGFFDIYFKSINYKEPIQKSEVQIKQDDLDPQQNPEQQSQQAEDQQQLQQQDQQQAQNQQKEEPYQKPEITQHDLDMVEAKKKINIIFKQPQNQLENVTAIVNLLVPYFEEEQPQDQNQEQQQQTGEVQQEETNQIAEPAKPVGKWDFDPKTIDIYDGEQPLIQEGVRSTVDSIYQYQFQEVVIVNDERAIEFARMQIYNFLKEKLESFMNVPEFSSLQFHKIKQTQANVPIFDFEL